MTWTRLADVIVPPWAVGLSMPAHDKVLVDRYATLMRHPATTPRPTTVRRGHLYVVGER